MEYRVLGPLEVRGGGDEPLPLGGAKQRALLALLLLSANRVVSRERLIDELWADEPPETAVTAVQVYVSRLRKLLPAETLLTRPPGYVLEVEPEAVDLLRFERLVGESRKADPERASRLLREALELWRGPPLAEFDEPFFRLEGGRLEDLRLAALEERVDADLALGRHTGLAGELETLIAQHPHRERLCGQLMLALYRSGRQAEALEAYRQARAKLDELGIEPSPRLRELEHAILTQDVGLDVPRQLVSETISLPGPLRVSSPFPFVGRSKELDALRSLLALAEQGEGGQVALISGEAGSGKTRLVRELAHEAADRGTLVLYGTSGAIVNSPYRPFVELLEFLLRVSDANALRDCLGTWGGELTRLLPDLAVQVGPLPDPVTADPETERRRLHMAVTELLASLSRVRPLLLVFDDLHWADAASLHLFRHLARAAPEARVLLLATYRARTEDAQPAFSDALSDLFRIDGVMRIALGALAAEDVADFIRRSARAEENDALSTLAHSIGELTDCIPFLVCELWRALVDSGAVEIADGGVRQTRPLSELASPESVREVVHFRLSRLAPSTIEMLEVAAVAGTQFDLNVLSETATLGKNLNEALRSGMVEEVPGHGLVHRFTHELVRRALYDRLTKLRRAELHLRVGEALVRAHGAHPERILPELAHHFTLAAPLAGSERAVEYNVRAAEAATASLAFEAAAANLSTALELVDDDHSSAEIACTLGFALRHCGELKRAEAILKDSVEAAQAAGDRRLAARAAVELAFVAVDAEAASTEPIAHELRRAIDVFEEFGDDLGMAKARHLLGYLDSSGGRFAAADEHYTLALVHAEQAHDRRQRSSLLLARAVSVLLGPTPVGEALERCDSMLTDVQADRILKAGAAAILGVLNAMAGRFRESRLLASRSLSTFAELGLELRLAAARWYAAYGALVGDDLETAEKELRLAYEPLERVEPRPQTAGIAALLAEVLCRRGQFQDAELFVHQARTAAGTDVVAQLTWRRAAAKIAAANGDLDAALETLREAAAMAERTDALNHQADIQVDLAPLLGCDTRASRAAFERALALYRRKQNAVAEARTAATLAAALTPS